MEPIFRIDPYLTIKQFPPIVWKVKFGDWNINYIWEYLYQRNKLEEFNQMDAEGQFTYLMDEFVTE